MILIALFVQVFIQMFIPLAMAEVLDQGVPFLSEQHKLEGLHRSAKIAPQQKKRLSEIYLLTSRCDELKNLLLEDVKTNPEALCVCGLPGCDYATTAGGLYELRKKLSDGMDFDSPEVQKIWKKLQLAAYSEAKYIAIKELRGRQIKGDAVPEKILRLMNEWESDLRKFEVNPK